MNVITSNFDHITKNSEIPKLFEIPRNPHPNKDMVRKELLNIKERLTKKEIEKFQKN